MRNLKGRRRIEKYDYRLNRKITDFFNDKEEEANKDEHNRIRS